MPPDTATGTFQTNLPTDLLSAVQRADVSGMRNDFAVGAMKPSLMERVIALFTRTAGAPRKR